MRAAGLIGKRGRHGQDTGAFVRERAVEVRKADVVTNRHADGQAFQIGDHGFGARMIAVALTVGLGLRDLDVEHVDLVVAGEDRPIASDQERPVGETSVRRALQPERADQNRNA